jgi:5-methylthioadenosine/S-adenosylhomocysteine deaminase
LSQIVYAANRNDVTDVWVNGRRVLASRHLATLDPAALAAKAAAWRDKILAADRNDN